MLLTILRTNFIHANTVPHIITHKTTLLLATSRGQVNALRLTHSNGSLSLKVGRGRSLHSEKLFYIGEQTQKRHFKMGSTRNQFQTLTLDDTKKAETQNGHSPSHSAELIERCKANAAKLAVDDNINSDSVIGIGSGSTMRYVLERIKQRCQDQSFNVKCIPTSFQAKQLIYDYGLPIGELDTNPVIDVTIDGADEIDENFVAIKGGGACLAQEKVIAYAANKFVVVADFRKDSTHLGDNWKKGIPIEVLPMACQAVRHHIARRFDADLEDLRLRIGREKAGPVITDNGNFVIDWRFNQKEHHKFTASAWANLSNQLKAIPGVVETGIFANMIKAAYFGCADGTVLKKIPESDDEQDNANKDE